MEETSSHKDHCDYNVAEGYQGFESEGRCSPRESAVITIPLNSDPKPAPHANNPSARGRRRQRHHYQDSGKTPRFPRGFHFANYIKFPFPIPPNLMHLHPPFPAPFPYHPYAPPPRHPLPPQTQKADYAQHFVNTGQRPQNFIRDSDMSVVPDNIPALKELIAAKDRLNEKKSFNPMYLKCDLRNTWLSTDLFGTKFDAILIDPPIDEYVRRGPLGEDEFWSWDEIKNLPIGDIADVPCFVFLWVGNAEGLEKGRECLKAWNFRRIDDICWLKTNKTHPARTVCEEGILLRRTKEHCLVGLKGMFAVEKNPHLMHPHIDTDVVVTEEPPLGSRTKPDYLYNIIEHLVQGRRRLELFGNDCSLRRGWLTVGPSLSSSNFNKEIFLSHFCSSDGSLCQGFMNSLVPPGSSHLLGTTPLIESLR